MLDVVNSIPEKDPENFQKLLHATRQVLAGEDLDQVAEVVRAVEGDPAHRFVADQPRRHHERGEPRRVNALGAVAVEVDALAAEELDGVGSVGITRHVEVVEVELPDEARGVGAEVGEVAAGVGERESNLDEAERVDVGLENLVVIGRPQLPSVRPGGVQLGAEYQAGKLGVHGDVREVVDDVLDELELGFQIVGPDFANHDGLGIGIPIRIFLLAAHVWKMD